MSADAYDSFAATYDAENARSLLNAHYERPHVLALAGDVRGKRVLDVGCGSGRLSAALIEAGADVTGFDGSPAMLDLARERLGPEVPLTVHDLAEPLPYEDGSFDVVIASLVLHYLADWSGPLAELRRVLEPGGRLIASVNHPFVRPFNEPQENYFAVRQYTEEVELDGQLTGLRMWHRPLTEVIRPFVDSGLILRSVDEPGPAANTPTELLPPRIASGERSAFLAFLFVAAEKPVAP